jgi:arginase
MRNRFILTPFFLDQPIAGLNPLVEADWVINNPSLPDRTRLERMAALYEPLAVLVQTTVAQEERPVSIAGDCCTSLGVLAGLQRAGIDPTLIGVESSRLPPDSTLHRCRKKA